MEHSQTVENMIRWALEKIGESEYSGWCLSFIEDALEISNQIEIFGGDCAKESCNMYYDAIQLGEPERGAFVFYDCLCQSEEGTVNWGHCGSKQIPRPVSLHDTPALYKKHSFLHSKAVYQV